MDSHVLLHAFREIKHEISADISAVHVDHGINQDSAGWAEHCRVICAGLGIEFVQRTLDEQCPRGESVESWARSRRYGFFKECMSAGDILFTAQHLDDQAETMLIQLFRGSGPKGLSAMPEIRRFGSGWLARPLLRFNRDSLHDYALARGLSWIEDDMNADQDYDRSFLRHGILPQLRARWPSLSRVLARASEHQAEAAALLDNLAAFDIKTYSLPEPDTLSLNGIQNLSMARRRNMLRYWFRRRNLPVPDSSTLQHILSEVVASRVDAQPCIHWHGMEIRRYRQVLCLVTRPDHNGESVTPMWNLDTEYATCLGKLRAERGRGGGIRAASVHKLKEKDLEACCKAMEKTFKSKGQGWTISR